MDFQLSVMPPFQLVFPITESRLPIEFSIIDDAIIENIEDFQLVISIPGTNPPTGYSIGMNQSALVQIDDNDGIPLILLDANVLTSSNNYVHGETMYEMNAVVHYFIPIIDTRYY